MSSEDEILRGYGGDREALFAEWSRLVTEGGSDDAKRNLLEAITRHDAEVLAVQRSQLVVLTQFIVHLRRALAALPQQQEDSPP
jgi:hypothetical protein